MEKKVDFFLRQILQQIIQEAQSKMESENILKVDDVVFLKQKLEEIEKETRGLNLGIKPLNAFIESYKPIETYKVSNPILMQLNNFFVFRKGLIVIGGLTHSGKTYFLLNILLDLLQNNDIKVIYVALDDSINHLLRRIASILFSKNIKEIEAKDIQKLSEFPYLQRLYFVNHFENIIEFLDYDVIAIDYFQNIASTAFLDTKDVRQFLNQKLYEIKQFVNIHQKTVILVSQLNRQAQTKKKENEFSENYYYRETSELENVADVAIDIKIKHKDTPIINQIILKKNKEYPTFYEKEVVFYNGILSEVGETFEDSEEEEKEKKEKKKKEKRKDIEDGIDDITTIIKKQEEILKKYREDKK